MEEVVHKDKFVVEVTVDEIEEAKRYVVHAIAALGSIQDSETRNKLRDTLLSVNEERVLECKSLVVYYEAIVEELKKIKH